MNRILLLACVLSFLAGVFSTAFAFVVVPRILSSLSSTGLNERIQGEWVALPGNTGRSQELKITSSVMIGKSADGSITSWNWHVIDSNDNSITVDTGWWTAIFHFEGEILVEEVNGRVDRYNRKTLTKASA